MSTTHARKAIVPDPAITEAKVMRGKTVKVGDPVRHFKQRYPATARVLGFAPDPDSSVGGLVVIVDGDTLGLHGRWAADRTEHAPEVLS